MAKKVELSNWINENVADDAVWGEYFVIAHKEEYKSGSKIRVEQSVSPIKDATITGKEIKQSLGDQMSSSAGIIIMLLGIAWTAVVILLKKPMESSTGAVVIGILIGMCGIIGGIYMVISAKKATPEIMTISSWEKMNPYIEEALSQKVFNEEVANRKKEMGDEGAGFAGYYCLPARSALKGEFDKAKSNFGLAEDLKASLIQAASTVPEDGLELTRR